MLLSTLKFSELENEKKSCHRIQSYRKSDWPLPLTEISVTWHSFFNWRAALGPQYSCEPVSSTMSLSRSFSLPFYFRYNYSQLHNSLSCISVYSIYRISVGNYGTDCLKYLYLYAFQNIVLIPRKYESSHPPPPPGAENMIPPPGRGNWAPWEIVFLVPRTWNNIKQFKTHSRKLGKNVNLFYLNKNYFKSKQKKY